VSDLLLRVDLYMRTIAEKYPAGGAEALTHRMPPFWLYVLCACTLFLPESTFAHGVDSNTERFLLENAGRAIVPFLYIGAKHMITGYDHLLFLVGVIFFLYRSRDVLIYEVDPIFRTTRGRS
jgi:hypothetical protein